MSITDDTTTTEPTEPLADPAHLTEAERTALHGIRPADLTEAERTALDGILPASLSARDRLTTPVTRPAIGLPSGSYLNVEVDDMPGSLVRHWHAVSPPATVREARQVLDDAIAADLAARADFQELPNREAAEVAELGRAAVAGAPLPDLTDWHRERLVLVARHGVLAQRVKDAKVAYGEAVTAALPEWRTALVTAIEPARLAAREAFAGVAAAVAEWERLKAAAHAVDAAAHPGDGLSTRMTREAGEIAGPGAGATSALAKYLASDDPIISGSYLERTDPLRPTRYEREVLNETASGGSQLEAIEIAERGAFTSLAKHWRNQHFYDREPGRSSEPARRQVSSDQPFANTQQP